MKSLNGVFAALETTVFEAMSRLAAEHGAVNLGQGFPDEDGPEEMRRAAAAAFVEGPNQYPPMLGLADLRRAVAEHEARFYGLGYDWTREVVVTSGATEALADCLFALIEPGDEVVLFEPLYDSYLPIVRRAGGLPRLVRLEPPGWRLDPAALAAAFGPRTKLVLLNNPMNPAAKAFDEAELSLIAAELERWDALAVCDEVYEHILFDGRGHVPFAALPGMRSRSLKIGSAGKTFSLTGWKVGYVAGPAELIAPVAKAHQYVTFTTPPALQMAVAQGLGREGAYYRDLAAGLQAKRDRLTAGLAHLGFSVPDCAGTYFVLADFRPLGLGDDDVAAARRLTIEAGVATVPVSAFYAGEGPRHYLRFCFCKRDAVLDEALARLGAYLGCSAKEDRAVL